MTCWSYRYMLLSHKLGYVVRLRRQVHELRRLLSSIAPSAMVEPLVNSALVQNWDESGCQTAYVPSCKNGFAETYWTTACLIFRRPWFSLARSTRNVGIIFFLQTERLKHRVLIECKLFLFDLFKAFIEQKGDIHKLVDFLDDLRKVNTYMQF